MFSFPVAQAGTTSESIVEKPACMRRGGGADTVPPIDLHTSVVLGIMNTVVSVLN